MLFCEIYLFKLDEFKIGVVNNFLLNDVLVFPKLTTKYLLRNIFPGRIETLIKSRGLFKSSNVFNLNKESSLCDLTKKRKNKNTTLCLWGNFVFFIKKNNNRFTSF
jgi:hypothetical protein